MHTAPIITLLTDFGTSDAYVGIMKGVALGICPAARLIDLTHEVPPQAIQLGALLLRSAVEFFPNGTVHLAIVDPGVGTARAPVLVVTERALLVGPDNGLLAPAAALLGVRAVYRLTREEYFRRPVSDTFHGRDVFAPVAAHLAAGTGPESFGPLLPSLHALELSEPRVESDAVHGEVVYVDRYGNLISNIPAAALTTFNHRSLSVRIAGMTLSPIASTYAAVVPGAPVALIGSWRTLEVGVRDGNAASHLGAGIGAAVSVEATRTKGK